MGYNISTIIDLPKQNNAATTNPTVNDDISIGYTVGSRWINAVTDAEYVCTDHTDGAAGWVATAIFGGGEGTVTSASVVTANGVSGSVATATTTPAITLTLGAITPTSVASVGAVTGSNLSGTNTGDQTNITGNAATVTTNANLTGPITSTGNATAIASQTGTGSKFVVDTEPTLINPTLTSGVLAITAVDTGTKKFTIAGNYATRFKYLTAYKFRVTGSIGNDGVYTVSTATDVSATTEIVVTEAVPSAVADGSINIGTISGIDGALKLTVGGSASITPMVIQDGQGSINVIIASAGSQDADYKFNANDNSFGVGRVIVGPDNILATGWVSGGNLPVIGAKGSLVVGTSTNNAAELAIGTNGQLLTADSTQTTGTKWATPASGATQESFAVYATAQQTLATATATKIAFDTEVVDTEGAFDNVTNYRYTPNVAGDYQINAKVTFATPAASFNGIISVYKNGSIYERGFTDASTLGNNSATVSTIIPMNGTTDYLEVFALQQSGVSQQTYVTAKSTSFSGIKTH